jgi:iron(III) transport system ATP-binding protein
VPNNAAAIEVRGLSKSFGAGVPSVLRQVDLDVPAGSIVALLGPSGCGKTTLLRTIAGLERADAGTVRIAGQVLTGPDRMVAPEKRRVGMVFQDWALFPHLTVARNVGYGVPKGADRARLVEEALDMVGLGGLGHRVPGTLSGGQQQRVALARALAPRPAVLLLDEPFSNLDTTLRVQVRSEVHRLLRELDITTVFVTHDQAEAFVLGDEVAVMRAGEIVQQARPAALYAAPATRWVATFVGEANLVAGTASGPDARTELGRVTLKEPADGPVEVLLRPEHLDVVRGDDAEVELIEYYGHDTVYVVRLAAGTTVRARVGADPSFDRGERVAVRYAGPPVVAYPVTSTPTPTPTSTSTPPAPPPPVLVSDPAVGDASA